MKIAIRLLLLFALQAAFAHPIRANADDMDFEQLDGLSLAELMDVVVTSSSKKPERLADAPTAIYVITNDDIRRSGVTTIPEALRMAPGIQVARIDANKWAVSARGFNGRFANKLLVLIDGRSIYTPTFSGVYWEAQDVVLEDIERIEVVRGPGATLWGSNAVNGVINIITKHSRDTQGGLVTVGGGTEETAFTTVRYGGRLSADATYRMYTKYVERDDFVNASNNDGADEWDKFQGGFRIDWSKGDTDTFTVQGDVYKETVGQTYLFPSTTTPPFASFEDETDISGLNLVGRWERNVSETSGMFLQLYYDNFQREDLLVGEETDIFDVDYHHRFGLGIGNDVIWGFGYRLVSGAFEGTDQVAFVPADRTTHFYSAFVQDDIELVEDRLHLVIGSKFEHSYYSGFEYQPNIRLMYTPSSRQSIWGAVSRAVRTPSRAADDVLLNNRVLPANSPGNPFPLPIQATIRGHSDFESEELLAYEFGYRVSPTSDLSLDIAVFYNDYDDLRSFEVAESITNPTHIDTYVDIRNRMDGEAYGIELAADWSLTDWWRLQSSYAFQRLQLHIDNGSSDTTSEPGERRTPQQQAYLRSSFDITTAVSLDVTARFVDGIADFDIDGYTAIDVRLAWSPTERLVVSVVGQNLLDDRHPEYQPRLINTVPTEVQSGVYGKVAWQF